MLTLKHKIHVWFECEYTKANDSIPDLVLKGLNQASYDIPLIITINPRFYDETATDLKTAHGFFRWYPAVKAQSGWYNPQTKTFDPLTSFTDPGMSRLVDIIIDLAKKQVEMGFNNPTVLVDIEWLINSKITKWKNPIDILKKLNDELPADTTLLIYPATPGVNSPKNTFIFQWLKVWSSIKGTVFLDSLWCQKQWLVPWLRPASVVFPATCLDDYLKTELVPKPWSLFYTMTKVATPGDTHNLDWCWKIGQSEEALCRSAAMNGYTNHVYYPGQVELENQFKQLRKSENGL